MGERGLIWLPFLIQFIYWQSGFYSLTSLKVESHSVWDRVIITLPG